MRTPDGAPDEGLHALKLLSKDVKMIKLSVLYPHTNGARFDMEYYTGKHLPLVRQKLDSTCKGLSAERGLSGAAPGSAPIYTVMAHMLFDSIASLQSALAQHAPALMADIPNFTSIQPVLQISEVVAA